MARKRKGISKVLRFSVLERCQFRCHYCGVPSGDAVVLVVEHVHPFSRGGTDAIDNLVASCVPCNAGKRDRILNAQPVCRHHVAELQEPSEIPDIPDDETRKQERHELEVCVYCEVGIHGSLESAFGCAIAEQLEHIDDVKSELNSVESVLEVLTESLTDGVLHPEDEVETLWDELEDELDKLWALHGRDRVQDRECGLDVFDVSALAIKVLVLK